MPPLILHATTELDCHVELSHAVPPVMSEGPAALRPVRNLPLLPKFPKFIPTIVIDDDPDDGAFTRLLTVFATGESKGEHCEQGCTATAVRSITEIAAVSFPP